MMDIDPIVADDANNTGQMIIVIFWTVPENSESYLLFKLISVFLRKKYSAFEMSMFYLSQIRRMVYHVHFSRPLKIIIVGWKKYKSDS